MEDIFPVTKFDAFALCLHENTQWFMSSSCLSTIFSSNGSYHQRYWYFVRGFSEKCRCIKIKPFSKIFVPRNWRLRVHIRNFLKCGQNTPAYVS